MPQERKVVTVLFADIVDSSTSTRSYDAEVLRAALARTFSRTREILQAHGATVEKFIGDAVMAVFGVPAAHEDDADRAIRAALALRDEVASPRPDGRPGFTLRIGINTGEVVTGDLEGAESLVTGGPVIVAARLEENAQHGEILAGPLTRQLTRARIRYGPPRTIDAKGMGRIEVAPVEGVLGAWKDRSALPTSPFVGRDAELRILGEMRRRVATTGRPHLVTVFADAGMGKSRLAGEFLATLGAEPAARVTCLPYGRAITYWPLQELIRGEAGISPTDPLDDARAKIEKRVSELAGFDEQERRAVVRELTALALAGPEGEPSDLTSELRRRELALGMTRYLEARLGTTPGTIVLEDLHWAEEPLLALLEELLEHLRAPLLLVCLARTDLLVRRPNWGSGRSNAIAITLEPLDREETERLARTLLGDGADERVREIVTRTEGNPLFVEEYVRMLEDQGSGAIVPPTLHGVIAARLDALRPAVKRLLQEASVVGREFWLDALPNELASADADADEAERRGLIGRTAMRGPTGTHTYSFRHGLIRDVAYASLSKAERTQVHDRYSKWLERAAGERASEYAEIVAYHAERAFHFAHELDPSAGSDLGHRAFTLLSRSASAASARGEFRTARELIDRAFAVADAGGVAAAERASAHALSAIVKLRLDSDSAAVGELDDAIASARAAGPSDDLVRLLIWRASSVTIFDDVARARELFAEAVAVAKATGDGGMVAYAVWASSEPVGITGQLDEQARLLSDALAQMRDAGITQWEVSCLTEIALNAIERGDVTLARSRAREAVALASRGGRRIDGFKAADAWARALLASGDPDASAAAAELISLAHTVGGHWAMARAAEVASLARELAGDVDGASLVLADTLAQFDSTRMPTQREAIARLEAMRSRLALASGDIATARSSAEAALRAAPPTHVAARASANLAAAAVAHADGDDKEARRLIDEARAVLAPTQYGGLRERAEHMAREILQPSGSRRSSAR